MPLSPRAAALDAAAAAKSGTVAATLACPVAALPGAYNPPARLALPKRTGLPPGVPPLATRSVGGGDGDNVGSASGTPGADGANCGTSPAACTAAVTGLTGADGADNASEDGEGPWGASGASNVSASSSASSLGGAGATDAAEPKHCIHSIGSGQRTLETPASPGVADVPVHSERHSSVTLDDPIRETAPVSGAGNAACSSAEIQAAHGQELSRATAGSLSESFARFSALPLQSLDTGGEFVVSPRESLPPPDDDRGLDDIMAIHSSRTPQESQPHGSVNPDQGFSDGGGGGFPNQQILAGMSMGMASFKSLGEVVRTHGTDSLPIVSGFLGEGPFWACGAVPLPDLTPQATGDHAPTGGGSSAGIAPDVSEPGLFAPELIAGSPRLGDVATADAAAVSAAEGSAATTGISTAAAPVAGAGYFGALGRFGSAEAGAAGGGGRRGYSRSVSEALLSRTSGIGGGSGLSAIFQTCIDMLSGAVDVPAIMDPPDEELTTIRFETKEQRLQWREFLSEAVSKSNAGFLFRLYDVEAEPPRFAKPPPSVLPYSEHFAKTYRDLYGRTPPHIVAPVGAGWRLKEDDWALGPEEDFAFGPDASRAASVASEDDGGPAVPAEVPSPTGADAQPDGTSASSSSVAAARHPRGMRPPSVPRVVPCERMGPVGSSGTAEEAGWIPGASAVASVRKLPAGTTLPPSRLLRAGFNGAAAPNGSGNGDTPSSGLEPGVLQHAAAATPLPREPEMWSQLSIGRIRVDEPWSAAPEGPAPAE